MALLVRQFPCLQDNYGFLLRDETSGKVACVDTPDPDAILAEIEKAGWGGLDLILNTHWHPDHAGGNERLKEATGCTVVGPAEVERLTPVDRLVGDGDVVELGETLLEVIATPGHTLGHIVYWDAADGIVFVGDTLFAMGCGRLFEGAPEQMWASLSRLADMPDETVVYCAHEYTAANARFALSVDSDPEVRARAEAVFAARTRGEPTVPTTIGLEKATNPFLRAPALVEEMGESAAFARVRAAKDSFAG